jgi:hypothetical protein
MDIPPTILPRKITFELSRDLSRVASRRYYSRKFLKPLGISCIGVALCILSLIYSGSEGAGVTWLLLGFFAFAILVFTRAYFTTLTGLEESRQRVTVLIEADGITWESSESVTTWKWSAVKRLWRFREVLLLFRYRKAWGCVVLPVAELGQEVSKAIEDKVRQNGGQVA